MSSATVILDRNVGRRVAPRTRCSLMVEYKDGGPKWERALLADLSVTGFKLSGIRPGFDCQSIWLRPLGMDPLPAKVRWAAGGSVGCEFLYPLGQETEVKLRELLAREVPAERMKVLA